MADRPLFLGMWRSYMSDLHEAGSHILPTDENLREYLRLYESYVVGGLHGFCLFGFVDQEVVGCLLIGEEVPPTIHLKTDLGRCANLWGVYIKPEYRGKHLAARLQDAGRPLIQELGFDTVVSSVLRGYTAGETNAFGWGAEPHATIILVRLGHGR